MARDYVGAAWEDIRQHLEDELMNEATTAPKTQRVIYHCQTGKARKGCGHTWAFDYEVRHRTVAGRQAYELIRLTEIKGIKTYVHDDHDACCPECQGRIYVKSSEVEGHLSEKKCDARCTGARGPHCDCSCGGTNHGAGWL
jgi:hypothetical protein